MSRLSIFTLALSLIVLTFTTSAPDAARAGGLWLPGHGVGPLGRGGAVVAKEGDLNGFWYNPALIGKAEGHQFLVDAALVFLHSEFRRAPVTERNGSTTTFDSVSNEAPPTPPPQLLFTSDLWGGPLKIGLGVYAPYASASRYAEWGPQRYSQIDSTQSLILYQQLVVAYAPIEQFSFGVSLQNITAIVDNTVMGSAYTGLWGEPEDRDLDALFNIHASDPITITGNFGFWGEPIEGLHLGLSAQLPATIEDNEAKLKTRLPSHYAFDNAQVEGDTLSVALELPWVIRGGVRYEMEGVFDVEVDVTYELWSVHDRVRTTPNDIKITGVPVVGEITLGPLDIDRNYSDVLGVSLGGDWVALPGWLTVRAGFMYEQGAIPDETFSVFQVDSEKFAPTLGATVHLGEHIDIEVGYAHIFQSSRDITNSTVRQINPAYEEGTRVVGNGQYDTGLDLFGGGVRGKF